ncbi:hypothetical protein IG631_15937 [Alternaria alternata]|nr:hypothetical protein IG631_15937 [Alternaria alternata]
MRSKTPRRSGNFMSNRLAVWRARSIRPGCARQQLQIDSARDLVSRRPPSFLICGTVDYPSLAGQQYLRDTCVRKAATLQIAKPPGRSRQGSHHLRVTAYRMILVMGCSSTPQRWMFDAKSELAL